MLPELTADHHRVLRMLAEAHPGGLRPYEIAAHDGRSRLAGTRWAEEMLDMLGHQGLAVRQPGDQEVWYILPEGEMRLERNQEGLTHE